ncbi:electron transfer flavoprotein subunit alpha/FixB family protein [Haloarcula sp. S1CR25-12]|uniref:Electron transfer flavoprotein subunit alpha/FixB family protein n=1 Tax=Haloarcula saliterrae TaxID=2950534 RepID=A0ABU2FC85_9EURY|nr:electron transfer flavoprotein subunit alpha/FixB family protein [Haloarcula sp. S1CR25-12]MDS0259877.1 electron transfer flavoprotein subunit alpha/FixB family protein [Haloarcula sp. S1CR25-12]
MTVLAVAEHRRGRLRDVSLELLSAGRELTAGTDRAVHAAVVGGRAERFADRLARVGVDVVHTTAAGEAFNHDVATQALTQLVEAVDADLVLAPHTVTGLDYAPALASRLDWPLVTDVIGLSGDDGLAVTRECLASKLVETLAVDGERAVLTLRPGAWSAAEGSGDADVRPFTPDIDDSAVRSTVTGFEAVGPGDVDLTDADVVVAVGRGIGSESNLDLIFDLADAMGATVAASSPPVKKGWLSADRQVGQSGAVVSPEVYVAVGVSGAVQHVAGMADSDTVIAVNSDPTAPIFDVADYGVVADLFDVVPELVDAFRPPER